MAPRDARGGCDVEAHAVRSCANPAQRVAARGSCADGGPPAPPSPTHPHPPLQVILVQDVPGLGAEGSLKSVPVGYWRNYLQPQGLAAFANAGILEQIKRQRAEEDRLRMEEKAKAQAMVGAAKRRAGCLGRGVSGLWSRFWAIYSVTLDWWTLGSPPAGQPLIPGSMLLTHVAAPTPCPPAAPHPQATALATIGKFVVKKKVGEGESIFGSVTSQELVEAIRMQTGRELDRKALSLPEIKSLGTYEATGASAENLEMQLRNAWK